MECKSTGGRGCRKMPLIWGLVLVLAPGLTVVMNAAQPAESVLELTRPLVIGHRGYPGFAPENTLPSFQLAKLAGADLVELDYQVDRDGRAIVIHDRTLDRTTNAVAAWGGEKVRVADKSLPEMQTLDAGSWFDPKYAGIKLPTLEEALEAIQMDGGMTLIERKEGDPEHIVELLKGKGLVNQVLLQSFDWEFITAVHALLPQQVLGAIGPSKTWQGRELKDEEKQLSPMWIDEMLQTGARFIVWNGQIDQQSIDYAHAKGLKLFIYTVNELDQAQALLAAGVDGIISNNIAIIWKAMALSRQ